VEKGGDSILTAKIGSNRTERKINPFQELDSQKKERGTSLLKERKENKRLKEKESNGRSEKEGRLARTHRRELYYYPAGC